MMVFFDTNVLVYLFDADAPAQQERARDLVRRHAASSAALVSTQVLQEFYVAVTRKLARPLDESSALDALRQLAALPVVQIDGELVLAAAARSQRLKLSFWDALIVEAAIQGGASNLFSEDLQHGRRIDGLTVENPFR
jgi:predicted nucleic acid-binding protein